MSRIEIWQSRMDDAPQKSKEIDKRHTAWMAANHDLNTAALEEMRSFLPSGISGMSLTSFCEHVTAQEGLFPLELMMYLKDCKLLHWLVTHPNQIAKSNFLSGSGSQHFKGLERYDVVEMRAVAAVLPEKFENDRDGASTPARTQH